MEVSSSCQGVFFPDEVLSSDNPKLLRSCFCMLWKWGKRMDSYVLQCGCRNKPGLLSEHVADLRLVGALSTWTIVLPSYRIFAMMTSLSYDIHVYEFHLDMLYFDSDIALTWKGVITQVHAWLILKGEILFPFIRYYLHYSFNHVSSDYYSL